MKWNDVKEKMPEEKHMNELFIVFGTGWHYTHVACFYNGKFYELGEDGDIMNVTHWMPLPKPPKEIK